MGDILKISFGVSFLKYTLHFPILNYIYIKLVSLLISSKKIKFKNSSY